MGIKSAIRGILTPSAVNSAPMAMHVAFLYADIIRYGGSIPGQPDGTAVFSCPDADTLNIFRVERIEE